jgi:uncharacterized membrane protein
MWHEHEMGSGEWIVMALVLIVVVALLVWAVLRTSGGDGRDRRYVEAAPGAARDEPPLKILDRRLAEGKISVEDYEQRKKILAGDGERSTD